MTRKHFEAIAYALRTSHPRLRDDLDIASDAYHARVLQWEATYRAVACQCALQNSALNRERFARAAGYAIRPDGSLYPWTAR